MRARMWCSRLWRGRPARMHALLLTALVALSGIVAVPRLDSAPPPRTTLLVLGDSLTWGSNYFAKAQTRLAATGTFDTVVVDSRWGRRISGPTSARYSGVVAYKTLVADGLRPTAVIVALGSNDVAILVKRREFVAVIDDLMNAIGNVPVVWLTVHRVDSANVTRQSQRFNSTLIKELARYPLATVFDWVSVATSDPSVVDPDKIHLTPKGYEVRAKVYLALASELAQRASDMTSTTTTTLPTTTIAPTTSVAPTTVPTTTVAP
ncbi:MAG: SGNH/GDSL hydrolase family protein [Actinobacteria bacterium]|nr:SGNH/GDSL hydrolase family protein [Actinomycetota bacterium]NCX79489.1 SGNH/GDSL hydrolase family protein [Actinomycetota bacterium]NDD62033.1 SGNH/GDSL hydrolase family protein [Actinomycetota bacterium]NDF82430.1 SGNH/GDSL hydrolase family protein [Actinomycetota bacterium]